MTNKPAINKVKSQEKLQKNKQEKAGKFRLHQ